MTYKELDTSSWYPYIVHVEDKISASKWYEIREWLTDNNIKVSYIGNKFWFQNQTTAMQFMFRWSE